MNPYEFVGNNVLCYTDPDGLALYAFDGTANVKKDETNISLGSENGWGGQHFEYLEGIGNVNENAAFKAIVQQATGLGLTAKRSTMLGALKKYINENDDTEVDVIGFSRGAVTAITFAEAIDKLKKKGVSPYCRIDKIRFMGLYDPVPGPFISDRPGIPDIVEHTAIAYALDEKRQQFKASVFSTAGIVARAFRGGHSDVGGGYPDRGLANISLEWMTDQGIAAGGPFRYPRIASSSKMLRHQEINYHLFLYLDRNNLGGIPLHPSVSRLVAGPTRKVTSPQYHVDVTSYTYYLDRIAPGRESYRVGDRSFTH